MTLEGISGNPFAASTVSFAATHHNRMKNREHLSRRELLPISRTYHPGPKQNKLAPLKRLGINHLHGNGRLHKTVVVIVGWAPANSCAN